MAHGLLSDAQALDMLNKRINPHGYMPERAAQEETMLRAMAFYCGKQHFIQNGATLYELPPENENEVHYRANIIMPAIERAVAKVMEASGDMRVAPADGSPEARRKAKLSDRVLRHINASSDYDDAREMALKWACIVGTGYLRVTWNPKLGDAQRYYTDPAGNTVLPVNADEALDLEKQGLFEDLAMGDVEFTDMGPFTVHNDWNSRKGVKECFWMAEHSLVSIPSIAEHFNLEESEINETGQVPGSAVYDEALAFMTSGTRQVVGFGYKPRQQEDQGRALLTVFYHRPTRVYPRGMYIVRVGEKIVMVRDNPYRDAADGLPFTKFDWNKMPGRYLGFGLAEQAMSSQFQYNAARGKMSEFQGVFGQPPIFTDDETFDTDNFILQPGALYSLKPGRKVFGMSAPQLPAEVSQNASIARSEVGWMTGEGDPDTSKAPGQMRSGAALAQFYREKNRPLTTPGKHAVKADRLNGRIALRLARANYAEERLLKMAGSNGAFEVQALRGSDIHYDLQIIGQPKDVDSIQVARAEMMDLIGLGAIKPELPDHWRALVNAFAWNTTDEAFQDFTMDQSNQEREIEEMIADPARYVEQPYPIAEFEDDEVHAQTIARFMKGDEFRSLDVMTQSVLYTHFQLHMQQVQKAMQEEMERIEAAKGAPGQKGEASQPSRS